MRNQEKDNLLKFLSETKDGKYAEIETSSIEYVRVEIETDLSSEYQDYVYSVCWKLYILMKRQDLILPFFMTIWSYFIYNTDIPITNQRHITLGNCFVALQFAAHWLRGYPLPTLSAQGKLDVMCKLGVYGIIIKSKVSRQI